MWLSLRKWREVLSWILLGGVVILSRWFFRSQLLFHNDSVQFALALNDFDITAHQPHPPGYVLYVLLGKFFSLFVDDANTAYVLAGILLSLVGLVLVVAFARRLFGEKGGWVAGLLWVANPAIWFHGIVAEVYIMEAVAVLGLSYLAYIYMEKGVPKTAIWLALAFGLLGGVRQSAMLFMLPLIIYVFWVNRSDLKRHALYAGGAFLAGSLLWALPVIVLSGGLGHYLSSVGRLASATAGAGYLKEGWNALIRNCALLLDTLKQALLPLLVLLFAVVTAAVAEESRHKIRVDSKSIWFFVWAMVPALAMLTVILVRNPGYTLFITALVIVLCGGAYKLIDKLLVDWQPRWGRWLSGSLLTIVIGWQIFAFFKTPALSFDYMSASLPSVKLVEEKLTLFTGMVERRFEPETSVVFVNTDLIFFGARHLQYYLPDYHIYTYRPLALAEDSTNGIWHLKGDEGFDFTDRLRLKPPVRYLILWGAERHVPKSDLLVKLFNDQGLWIGYLDLEDREIRELIKQTPALGFVDMEAYE